jgi:hypothetical protein
MVSGNCPATLQSPRNFIFHTQQKNKFKPHYSQQFTLRRKQMVIFVSSFNEMNLYIPKNSEDVAG